MQNKGCYAEESRGLNSTQSAGAKHTRVTLRLGALWLSFQEALAGYLADHAILEKQILGLEW